MSPAIRRYAAALAGAFLLIGCGSRPTLTPESVRASVGSDSSVITKLRIKGSVAVINTSLGTDQASGAKGLKMCQAIYESGDKPTIFVYGEVQPYVPILLARTAKEDDTPGDCELGPMVGDPALTS